MTPFPPGPSATLLADPPWRFLNSTGKVAPGHRRLARYSTMALADIAALPVADIAASTAHLYLWVPNAMLAEGLFVMKAWGFTYKTNIVWHKVRRDGGSDGRGVGFYFRNVTELVLFGSRGRMRTLSPGRRQVNLLATRKRGHSVKPDELYDVIEACSPGPRIELFARQRRASWAAGRRGARNRGCRMTTPDPAALRADLERRGVIKPRVTDPDGYDGKDDFETSINACYQAIRERVAAGGPAWEPKP